MVMGVKRGTLKRRITGVGSPEDKKAFLPADQNTEYFHIRRRRGGREVSGIKGDR